MNTALWAVQIVLALAFTGTGLLKAAVPYAKLSPQAGWVGDFSPVSVKLIGALELLGAGGIVLPALLNIAPWLTSLAALGFVLDMLFAFAVHRRRQETVLMVVNVVLTVLAVFVIYGRVQMAPA